MPQVRIAYLGLALTLCANPTAPNLTTGRKMTDLTVAPANMQLGPGQTQQYTTTATWGNRRPRSYSVTWSATGGTITPSGLYTAGSVDGTYKVCATSGAFMPCVDLTLITTPTTQTIAPGENWQSKVDANAAGTAFRVLAGTHARATVRPKTGDSFIGDPGAIMDGEDVTPRAFTAGTTAPYPADVTISGIEITRYHSNTSDDGAIRPSGATSATSATGWIVEYCNIHHNYRVGLRIGTTMIARYNLVHNNGSFGMSGPGDDVLVEGNTITYNGDATGTVESGGTKFVRTNGLIVRGNTVSNNPAPGLWLDIANDDFLVENNLIEDNKKGGTSIEISYGGTIQNNTYRRNGLDDTRSAVWPWGAGIGIKASGGTGLVVTGNVLEGNVHGIALQQQPRGTNHGDPSGVDAEMYVKNVWVHDNTITLQTVPGHLYAGSLGASQVVQDPSTGAPNIFSRNNRFTDNDYILNGVTTAFAWENNYRSATYWQGTALQDVGGSITP